MYFDFKFIFQKKEFHCLNTLIEVTFIRFRVRRNCKGLSLIIFVCLLQVARGSGELELTYSPAFTCLLPAVQLANISCIV